MENNEFVKKSSSSWSHDFIISRSFQSEVRKLSQFWKPNLGKETTIEHLRPIGWKRKKKAILMTKKRRKSSNYHSEVNIKVQKSTSERSRIAISPWNPCNILLNK